jgi:molybdopterin-guanine dinucleotide biosynthesis protein A
MPVVYQASEKKDVPYIKDVTGIILSGGRSTRYGRNKALVNIDGVSLIERVIRVMGSIFKHIILITNTPDEYAHLGFPMYRDIIKGLGPIGGVYTGLSVIPNEAGFFVACDMPLLNKALIQYIIENRGRHDAVVPRINGLVEALHALYTKGCLPVVKRLIDSRQYKTSLILKEASVSVRYLEEDEIRTFDPDLKSFINVNRPQELRRLERL